MSTPLRVRPGPDESAPALLNRLALRNGYLSVGSFAHARGITEPIDTTLPSDDAVQAIAHAAGHPFEYLYQSTFMRSGDGSMLLGAERVGPATLQLYAGVCPLCLEADREQRGGPPNTRPYMRNWWSLPQVASCPTHGCAIVVRCHECGGRLLHRLNGATCGRCGVELRQAPVQWADASASSYLVGRLSSVGGRSHPLLDGLTWSTAAAAIRKLGRIALATPIGQRRQRLGNVDRARIDSAGLALLDDWPNGFVQLVADLRENRKSPQFKRLLSWLGRSAPDPDPFRSIFDEMVPGRLRRPSDVQLLSGVEAARALGVGHGPFERLVKGGVISPSLGGAGERHGFYRRDEIDALLHSLSTAPLATHSASAVPITDAKRIVRIGVVDVIRAIQSGQIDVAGIAHASTGLNRILVKPADLVAFIPGWVPWKEVTSRLKLNQGASARDAVAFGMLKPPKRVGISYHFREEDLQECIAKYASVRDLRLRMVSPIDPRSLINEMRRAGLRSVCKLKRGGHIYLRSAAEALLPRLGYPLEPVATAYAAHTVA